AGCRRSDQISQAKNQPAAIEQGLSSDAVRLWISGPGGSGKSSLAFEAGRRALLSKRFLPVVVDFAWKGPLYDYIASVLNGPTSGSNVSASFASQVVRSGRVGVIFDGLSEIQKLNAAEEVISSVRDGTIKNAVITSRQACPDPELFAEIQIGSLGEEQLKKLI